MTRRVRRPLVVTVEWPSGRVVEGPRALEVFSLLLGRPALERRLQEMVRRHLSEAP